MASFSAAVMLRQLAWSSVKPAVRFPGVLPPIYPAAATTTATTANLTRPFTTTGRHLASVEEDDSLASASSPAPAPPQQGSLAKGSIFAEEDEDEYQPPTTSGAKPKSGTGEQIEVQRLPLGQRDREALDHVLDARPDRRAKLERALVIRALQRRGRLTRAETLQRTERECVAQSPFFKTSVKKLTKLARQIAGKSLDDALLQMKFSPKKAARDVREHLEHARDTATVVHGMGLGKVSGETPADFAPVPIVLKDGSKRVVTDPTNIYIAQAWVNRGPFDREPDHRARGQVYMMRPPYTGLTVVLKEEKTLLREARERQQKAERQRRSSLWTQLPDRPISAQNQYYSW